MARDAAVVTEWDAEAAIRALGTELTWETVEKDTKDGCLIFDVAPADGGRYEISTVLHISEKFDRRFCGWLHRRLGIIYYLPRVPGTSTFHYVRVNYGYWRMADARATCEHHHVTGEWVHKPWKRPRKKSAAANLITAAVCGVAAIASIRIVYLAPRGRNPLADILLPTIFFLIFAVVYQSKEGLDRIKKRRSEREAAG